MLLFKYYEHNKVTLTRYLYTSPDRLKVLAEIDSYTYILLSILFRPVHSSTLHCCYKAGTSILTHLLTCVFNGLSNFTYKWKTD